MGRVLNLIAEYILGKQWKLVLGWGIRWNATYSMIRRCLDLRFALDNYAAQLLVLKERLP